MTHRIPPKEHYFRHKDRELKDIHELLEELKVMNEEDFSHYVGVDHNYFIRWIRDELQDVSLAKTLEPVKDREVTIRLIEKRIEEIEGKKKRFVNKRIMERKYASPHVQQFDLKLTEFLWGMFIGILIGIFVAKIGQL